MSKLERLDALLDERDLGAVWFARPNSFAWLTGGSNVVDRETDAGEAAVGYDGDGLEVVTSNVEADRLRDEELPDEIPVHEFPWYEQSLAEAVADHSPDAAAADFDVPGFETIDASPLRQPLTDEDVENYRELGRETAAAVERVCRELQPTDVESQVASAIRIALAEQDIEAPVALVGGAERAKQYRHYTPTDAQLGDYALVSVTAERDGLHASLTRTVAFSDEDPESAQDPAVADQWLRDLGDKHHCARIVEVTALAATRTIAGLSGDASSVFDAIRATYEHLNHADEWEKHHQGGAAGYAGREWIATPDTDAQVTTPMAYAWNPTVKGAKSEDTVLVTEEDFEVLTSTGEWPTTAVDAYDYDGVIERPDVLVTDTGE